jgi:hypothetical protein
VDIKTINEMIQRESAFVESLTSEVGKVIVGQKNMVDRLLIGILKPWRRLSMLNSNASNLHRTCCLRILSER